MANRLEKIDLSRDVGLIRVDADDVTVVMPGGRKYRIGDQDWFTVSDYCEKYGRPITTVLMWIKRDIIKSEEIVVVAELNDLKLIRDIDYSTRTRAYRRGGVES